MSESNQHDDRAIESTQGWVSVFGACESGLRAFLSHRLAQEADIEDCLQVVATKMIEHGDQVAPAARRAWLFRVAANEAARHWRSRATAERILEKQANGIEHETRHQAIDELAQSEQTQQLRTAIQRLPPAWQQIVQLRIEGDLTFQQIATQLNIPLGTALTRMRRALQRLRDEIE